MLTFEKFLILKSVNLFQRVPNDVLMQVATALKEMKVPAGKTIVQKDESGTTMYVVIEGKVKVHDGEKTIVELNARDVFGELSALSPEKRIASVSAVDDTFLLKMDREALFDLMGLHIELAESIIEFLCYRVRQIAKQKQTLQ